MVQKIKNKYENENVFKRLAKIESEFRGASVLIHHKGELKPNLAKLWGSKKLLDIVENWVGPDISGPTQFSTISSNFFDPHTFARFGFNSPVW